MQTIANSRCADGDCSAKTSGTVTSPDFPLNYPIDKEVTLPLMVAEGSAIQLTFTSLDIEECNEFEDGTKGHCLCDYVEVLDTDQHQILKACGANLPEQLTSTGHMMTVVFHSDHSTTHKGFSADWKLVSLPEAVTSGEVSSPNYPENYPDNLKDRTFPIRVAKGKRIELTIEDLALEDSSGCSECTCDHLEIKDTPVDGPASLMAVSKTVFSDLN